MFPAVNFEDVDFDQLLLNDTWPIPHASLRNFYGETDLDYWITGLGDYLTMRKLLSASGCDFCPGNTVVDMGGSSGRVMRHIALQATLPLKLHVVDAPDLTAFLHDAQTQRPSSNVGEIQFTTFSENALLLDSCTVDILTAFSVFTHFYHSEQLWLREVHRVLKPGGVFYCTLQTEKTWISIKDGGLPFVELLADFFPETQSSSCIIQGMGDTSVRHGGAWHRKGSHFMITSHKENGLKPVIFEEISRGLLDKDMYGQGRWALIENALPDMNLPFRENGVIPEVTDLRCAEVLYVCTFHHLDYIRRVWGKLFEVTRTGCYHGFQEIVIFKKK